MKIISLLIILIFNISFSSVAQSQERTAEDFQFLLKKVVFLEREMEVLNREHESIGNAVYTNDRLNADYSYLKEEVAVIRHKVLKINDQIEKSDFSPEEVFELKRRLQK